MCDGENDAAADFLDKLEQDKHERFDARVAEQVLKGLHIFGASIALLRGIAQDQGTEVDGFTPEWVSDYLSCPVTFRAVKDFRLDTEDGFPDPLWLMSHYTYGPRFSAIWRAVWNETFDRFGGSSQYIAAVFRPKYAKGLLVLHNYEPVTRYTGSGSGRFMMLRATQRGPEILQYLKPMLDALRSEWTPVIPVR